MVNLSGEKIDKNNPRAIQKALYKDMLKYGKNLWRTTNESIYS